MDDIRKRVLRRSRKVHEGGVNHKVTKAQRKARSTKGGSIGRRGEAAAVRRGRAGGESGAH
jgi:hypothetical protein